jgi:hypothetical protein
VNIIPLLFTHSGNCNRIIREPIFAKAEHLRTSPQQAASAFNKSSLFPNKRHTCLMAKEKKVSVQDSPKYSTSSDEDSSDDEVDYSSLFKGLDRAKVEKINELIDDLNEKDRLLEKQEDILYESMISLLVFKNLLL